MPSCIRGQGLLLIRSLVTPKNAWTTSNFHTLRNKQIFRCLRATSLSSCLHNSLGIASLSRRSVSPVSYSWSSTSPSKFASVIPVGHFFQHRKESTVSSSDAANARNVRSDGGGSNTDSGKDPSGFEGKPKKESWWRGKNSWKLGLVFLGGAVVVWGITLIGTWGAPLLDPDGNEIEDEFTSSLTPIAYLRRTWKEMNIFKQKIQDPSREKLLPDPLKYPYIQPPYTLVIELTGVLIHPDWTYNTGWRFKKRPGIDYFLNNIGPPLYEVVIYSKEAGMTADPLVNHLDPQGFIMYRLYRDATRYQEGTHLKDLSCLNRDMSRVIMLDCSDDAVKLQPRNAFVLKKWEGQDEDRTLIDLAHFLKTIAASGVDDVRPVLDYYHQFDEPLTAFQDNQRKLQEEEAARAQAAAEETKKKSWLAGFRK